MSLRLDFDFTLNSLRSFHFDFTPISLRADFDSTREKGETACRTREKGKLSGNNKERRKKALPVFEIESHLATRPRLRPNETNPFPGWPPTTSELVINSGERDLVGIDPAKTCAGWAMKIFYISFRVWQDFPVSRNP